MPYVTNPTANDFASKGVGITALVLSSVATAAFSGLFGGGNGAGLFGGNNPASSASYQLSQKDTEIAQLKAERYSDQQTAAVNFELSNVKQRLAAMEAAAPLREKIVGDQIGFVSSTVNRLVQPMIPDRNVAYPTSTTEQSA